MFSRNGTREVHDKGACEAGMDGYTAKVKEVVAYFPHVWYEQKSSVHTPVSSSLSLPSSEKRVERMRWFGEIKC